MQDVLTNGVATAHYGYDANGNRLSRSGTGGEEAGVYDDHDRILSYGRYQYVNDANGLVESVHDTQSGTSTTLDYNVRGWLRGATLPDGRAIRYDVDPFGRRVAKRVDGQLVSTWVYRDALRPLGEFDGSGNLKWRFFYGERANVPSVMVRGSTVYRVISDPRGSVRLLVEANTGTVAQRLDYDEFGRVLTDTNPGFQPFGFAGGLYDADTGLVRFGAPDYDAVAGRWTAADPSQYRGKQLNLYAYAYNNPVNFVDPAGAEPFTIATIIVIGVTTGVGALLGYAASAEGQGVWGALVGGGTGLSASIAAPVLGPLLGGTAAATGLGGQSEVFAAMDSCKLSNLHSPVNR